MNDQPAKHDLPEGLDEETVNRAAVALRSIGHPNSIAQAFDFWDDRYAWRRLFSEVLGTFFLVLVAVGAGMVNARFGGQAVPYGARVVAPALMVMAVISARWPRSPSAATSPWPGCGAPGSAGPR
jgi:hypothetical protein